MPPLDLEDEHDIDDEEGDEDEVVILEPISDDDVMTVAQFTHCERSVIELFHQYWIERHAQDPEKFPMEQTIAQWEEHVAHFDPDWEPGSTLQ